MSWSGPVAGAPPFQQPPYNNNQQPPYNNSQQPPYNNNHSAYGQQLPYQYGQQPQQPGYGQPRGTAWPASGPPQRAPDNRPSKKKAAPVITRYPPPPGYRGPAQPQGPFGANQYSGQYQQSQPVYPSGPQAPPSYTPQVYNAAPTAYGYQAQGYRAQQPQNYAQSAYPSTQGHQWPQQGYASNTGYSQSPIQSSGSGWAPPQMNYQGHPPQPVPNNSNQQAYSQAGPWPSNNGPPQMAAQNSHVSSHGPVARTTDPNATPTPATVHMATSQAALSSNQSNGAVNQNSPTEKPQIYLSCDDWDFDFDGAIWPKSNEPVDPALSLGVIIWHPAKQMTRALPSTFEEAEKQASEAAPEGLGNGDSVSMYFTAENSHEAFLDVRQTDDWDAIRDDPVFVVFTDEEMQKNVVSIEDCIAQRDRPDESSDTTKHDEDQEMHDASWDIMENLEQALTSRHVDSQSQPRKLKDVPSPTQAQEDILAKLGVTGTPKPPSHNTSPVPYQTHETQLTASNPEKSAAPSTKPLSSQPAPSRAHSYSGLPHSGHNPSQQRSYGSMSSGSTSRPPPPPPPPEQPHYDPWNAPQHDTHAFGGRSGSPATSEGSNRTMAGSDFESGKPSNHNDHENSAAPSLPRSDSSNNRKRSYEDADKDGEQSRQQDDHSKRKRRAQVDAAYSRR